MGNTASNIQNPNQGSQYQNPVRRTYQQHHQPRTNITNQSHYQQNQQQRNYYQDQYIDQPSVLRPNYYNQKQNNGYNKAQRLAQEQLNKLQNMNNSQRVNRQQPQQYVQQQQPQQYVQQYVQQQQPQQYTQQYVQQQQPQQYVQQYVQQPIREHQPKQFINRPEATRDTDLALNDNMRMNKNLGMHFKYPEVNQGESLKDIEARERREFEEREESRRMEFRTEQNQRREYFDEEIKKFEEEYNPYQVLGVDEGCSEKQLKKKYKRLALKYHPDRNEGKTDEEFKIITQSYLYILKKKGESSKYEKKTKRKVKYKAYEDDINEQRENIHLDKDNFNLNKFNKIFDKYKMPTAFDDGYGSMMNKGNRLADDPNVENIFGKSFNLDVFNSTFKGEKRKKKSSQIVEYEEPKAINLGKNMGFSELGVDEIDNYGVKNEGLGYTDYRIAHHEENTLINPDEVDYKQYKSVNELKASRSNISYNLSKNDKRRIELRKAEEKRREERRIRNLQQYDNNVNNQYKKINRLMIGNRR